MRQTSKPWIIYLHYHIRLLTNVLVVGSGAREHSLGWKISQSEHVDDVFYAPGNGGTKNNIPINVEQIEELVDFASKNDCFTIVGPEVPLASTIG